MRHLPPEAALHRSLHGAQADWRPVEQLLAGVCYRLEVLAWQNGGGKGPKPKPHLGPGHGPTRSTLSSAELAARLEAQKARTRPTP